MRRLALEMGVPSRLFPFPVGLLKALGKISGRFHAIDKLSSSLMVNSGKIRRELGWTPPHSLAWGLKETARHFAKNRPKKKDE